jgi:hypothetical protein
MTTTTVRPTTTVLTLTTVLGGLCTARRSFANPEASDAELAYGAATRAQRCKVVVEGLCNFGALDRGTAAKVEDAYVTICTFCIAFHDEEFTNLPKLRREAVADLDIAIRAVEDAIYVRTPGRHVSADQDAAEGASLARMAPLGGE